MARTAEADRLTRQHRTQQLAIRAGSLRDLVTLWRVVDARDLSGTIDTFVRAAVLLTRVGHADSAAVAARYYRMFREAEGVPGAAPLVPLPNLDLGDAAGAIRGAALRGIVVARRAGASVDVAQQRGFVRTAGEITKLVLTGGRVTLLDKTRRDPRALGWQRVTSGDPCAFCRMLASRGPVYRSERSAEFETHGACGCTAEIVYDDRSPFRPEAERYLSEFTTAQAWARANPDNRGQDGASNPALNAYRRWLAAGSPSVPS